MDNLYSLEEVEYLVKNKGIVPFAMAKQLADTMREVERLRDENNIMRTAAELSQEMARHNASKPSDITKDSE